MRLLCWFSHHMRYNAFRLEELEALAADVGISKADLWPPSSCRPSSESEDVFVYCNLPNEAAAKRIQSRSILIKGFIEVWSEGLTYESIREELMNTKMDLFRSHINDTTTWAFKFISFSKNIPLSVSKEKMNEFACLFKGDEKVNLDNADTTLIVAEDWKHRGDGSELRNIYVGRAVAYRSKGKVWWHKYNLPQRPVLGPTTLDTELAFLMCHQASIDHGKVVMDPFVGTGSILIAASHLGAYCIGADIDVRVLKGWGIAYLNKNLPSRHTGRSDIFRNFSHYDLQHPEIIRGDISASIWRTAHFYSSKRLKSKTCDEDFDSSGESTMKGWVDAVITDPPYGIRAGARKAGYTKRHNVIKRAQDNVFPTSWYDSQETIGNLLDTASDLLVDSGKLVFLLLVETECANKQVLAVEHPNFEVLSVSPQLLSGGRSRYLVTMQRKKRERK